MFDGELIKMIFLLIILLAMLDVIEHAAPPHLRPPVVLGTLKILRTAGVLWEENINIKFVFTEGVGVDVICVIVVLVHG